MKTPGSQPARRCIRDAAPARRRALSCAVALALLAALARPSATMAAEGSGTATDDGEQEARRHYAEGDAAYKTGHYDEALKEFEAGYAVSRRPGFLLNMAHSERKLGHLREARALYKKYLLVDPNSKLRGDVRALIGDLDRAVDDEDRAERNRKSRDATGAGATAEAAPASSVTSARPAVSTPLVTAVPQAPRPAAAQPALLQQGAGPAAAGRGSASPPFYRRGWFWVAVGAIALTGAGAAIYLSRRPGTDPFHDSGTLGSLGN